jgi:hypothetical protein
MLTEVEHALFARAAEINTPEALRAALSQFVNNGWLRSVIDGRLRDSRQLMDAAGGSYRHDNGFWKIVLVETEWYKLRAHLWLEHQQEPAQPNIHNHRWHFSSVLLRGGYVQELFAICEAEEDGIPVRSWRYSPSAEGIAGDVEERGAARLKRVAQSTCQAGDCVVLAADELHRVISVKDATTISIVLNGPSVRADTDVYTQGRLTLLPENIERRLTAPELERAVAEVSHALGDYERQRR